MDSLAQAARAVDASASHEGREALLAALGFVERSLPLDAASRDRLGITPHALSARVSTGQGALRALTVELDHDASVRDCISAIARQLSTRSPHLLWLIVVSEKATSTLAIATWQCVRTVPRIAVMITERGRVVDSDAETVCALAATSPIASDTLRHMRWLDILGRDAVTRRFFNALTGAVNNLSNTLSSEIPTADSRQIALLATSRLLFLSFLETKGWLNADFGFLANGFAECMASGGNYQRRVLEPLFFGTLNTRVSERAPRARAFGRIPFLNGGLFSRTPVERIHRNSRLTDDALGALFGDVLVRYRFTAREDATTWSQAAIDPEMLGKVFESLMESGNRKSGGVYYTPHRFVERVTSLALTTALRNHAIPPGSAEHLLHETDPPIVPDPRMLDVVRGLKILDPACGSGAFLVHALERLALLRIALGDPAPASDVRRSVLTSSIFGVDSNPTAVWLCELRLWLSAVIDSEEPDGMRVVPLPNLDRQIRVGDSLAGLAFSGNAREAQVPTRGSVLRDRYARASGRRKVSLGRRLDIAERSRALQAIDTAIMTASFERREIIRAARSRDLFDTRMSPGSKNRDRLLHLRSTVRSLQRRRIAIARGETPAFAYTTHFSDVADAGGFDLVIGNPPWVRVHNMSPDERLRYREQFSVYRTSAWAEGARGAQAGRGFAGQIDLAALFIERSIHLLAQDGTLGLLLPSKLWRSLAGGGARQLILSCTRMMRLEDHSDGPDAFDATVYPSILITTKNTTRDTAARHPVRVAVQHRDGLPHWTVRTCDIPLDSTPGSPWLLLPPRARMSFDCLTRAGVPLFESVLRRPHLGVKTGCNDAFVVNALATDSLLTAVAADNRLGEIETHLLRPLVRGETLTQWRLPQNNERIIWTHDPTGHAFRQLPPHALRWLARSRRALEQRSDSRSDRWWSLFRVESAESEHARVVWADFGRAPRAAVLDVGDPTVPLNTCYSITCPTPADAVAFAAILNSEIAAAWLAVIAEPARGGYHRYLGWTVARLPIPIDWPRARRILAPIAEAALRGRQPAAAELNTLVLDAYELTAPALDPLLAWIHARIND
jgi:hypothetical protein